MRDDVGPLAADQVSRSRLADVEPVETGPGVQVALVAGREVVHDQHLIAALDQGIDQVRPDEPGAARDEDLQRGGG